MNASVLTPPAGLLTTVRGVRSLLPAQVAEGRPVKLRGVIVYHEPQGLRTVICDGEEAIYIHLRPEDSKPGELSVGMELEVEGVAAAGDFNTCIESPRRTSATFRILGKKALPPAYHLMPEELMEPVNDSRWIETRGLVRGVSLSAERVLLELQIGAVSLQAHVIDRRPGSRETMPWRLVDHTVRVRAVTASIFNHERQMTGRILLVPSMSEVVVESPAPMDLEALPVCPLTSLLCADRPDAFGVTKVQGIVTHGPTGNGVYLRGEDVGLLVQTAQPIDVVPGSVVEVIGFPALSSFRPFFRARQIRELRRETPPAPKAVTLTQILSGPHQSDLVSVEATFIKVQLASHQAILQFHAASQLFQARLEEIPDVTFFNALQPGSRVRVRGICITTAKRDIHALQIVGSFELLLRTSEDVTVLKAPGWWTSERRLIAFGIPVAVLAIAFVWLGFWTSGRALIGFGVAGAIAAVASAWAVLLRWRVAVLTARIQHDAIHGERLRIARDLHDDLGARVTHLGSLAALAEEDVADEDATREQFGLIRAGSREIVQALDAAVWAVNPENDSVLRLATYLCQWAGDFFHPTAIRCRFDVEEVLPHSSIPMGRRNDIFLAVKEALNNIVRHSHATEVWLRISGDDRGLIMKVEDNGCGLSAEATCGHGLTNIRQRVERAGGEVRIFSPEEGGTAIEFILPLN